MFIFPPLSYMCPCSPLPALMTTYLCENQEHTVKTYWIELMIGIGPQRVRQIQMLHVEKYTFLFKLEITSNKRAIKHRSDPITFPLWSLSICTSFQGIWFKANHLFFFCWSKFLCKEGNLEDLGKLFKFHFPSSWHSILVSQTWSSLSKGCLYHNYSKHFIVSLPCVRYHAKCFTYIISLNPHNNSRKWEL